MSRGTLRTWLVGGTIGLLFSVASAPWWLYVATTLIVGIGLADAEEHPS